MQNIIGRYPNFIFLGMPVTFSIRVLEGLLAAGASPSAVWIPENEAVTGVGIRELQPETGKSDLPLLTPYFQRGIAQLAWEHKIPLFAIQGFSSPDTKKALASLRVHAGIIACFSRRLPPDILTIPRSGFLNLHPSLLPAYRGPYPLFWTFRDGLKHSGVTLHHVDEGLDSGDIVLQSAVNIPDGIGASEADALFAEKGTALIVEALSNLALGSLPRRPQEEEAGHFGRPSADDFAIPTDWPAQRAFNFMRGTAEWGLPYRIAGDGFELLARSALAVDSKGILEAPIVRQHRSSRIRFDTGVLHVSDW